MSDILVKCSAPSFIHIAAGVVTLIKGTPEDLSDSLYPSSSSILTEGGDAITTESGDKITKETP